MKLYEITNQYENIFNQVNEDGEITDHTLAILDGLKHEFAEKAIQVACYIKNLEAEAQAIENAITNMKERTKKIDNKVESLKTYLSESMTKLNMNEINDSPYFKLKLKLCPVSVMVYDDTIIPEDCWNEKVVKTIDKLKIKEELTQGRTISGATLHRNIKLEIK
jgi:hypothetical protein